MKNREKLGNADRDLLLTADPNELRGIGDSAAARRVRDDAGVHDAAAQLLHGMTALDAAITKQSTSRTDSLRAGAATSAAPVAKRRISGVARATLLSGGLAAAAIAGVMMSHEAPVRAHLAVQKRVERPLTATLNASSSRPFAVIPTDNPDIAIVWLFNKETR